ncbi:hypothetical protein [Streptomyces sp. NBC_00078]|uniref:hypothetical protein n=1 Tax=unclassified Streptomyces TaxID=2593676 RepID=UPI00224FF682|nr:hypothetical protein [Streptomyces sp. NBC_00078]MCX5421314.1 hypothetical protein [Streptomyces sp. NBC_00078]
MPARAGGRPGEAGVPPAAGAGDDGRRDDEQRRSAHDPDPPARDPRHQNPDARREHPGPPQGRGSGPYDDGHPDQTLGSAISTCHVPPPRRTAHAFGGAG